MMNESEIRQYLEKDPLRHITMLKFLGMLKGNADSIYRETGAGVFIAVVYRQGALEYHANDYPGADRIVLAAGDDGGPLPGLVTSLPAGRHIVKGDPALVEKSLSGLFGARTLRRFVSLRAMDGVGYAPDPAVESAGGYRPEFGELFRINGYSETAIRSLLGKEGRVYFIREGNRVVSLCAVFHNHGNIWEIGALATGPEARRAGCAGRLVRHAAALLAKEGRIARYHVDSANTASLLLAEKCGFRKFMELVHCEVTVK